MPTPTTAHRKDKHISNIAYHLGKIRHASPRQPNETVDQWMDRTYNAALKIVQNEERQAIQSGKLLGYRKESDKQKYGRNSKRHA